MGKRGSVLAPTAKVEYKPLNRGRKECLEMPMIFDVALSQLIRERLQQDSRTAGATVDVTCTDGAICLTGRVDTQEQKDAALFVVKGMIGVRSIMDQIIIRR